MVRAVRHNLRAAFRLSVLLVLLGLGTVPVECSAVYGPHSIFITAEEVAQVRAGGQHHSHGAPAAHHDMAGMSTPREHAAISDVRPGEASTQASEAEVTSSMPAPASSAVDALIAIALFEPDIAPGPRDFAAISRMLPLPIGNPLLAPEPPPPQLGS